MTRHDLSPRERFWLSVKPGADDYTSCWIWCGQRRNGYGLFAVNYRSVHAHRWIFAQLHPTIDLREKVVMHTCDNPGCVNPNHLRVGTQKDNVQDAIRKRRFPSGTRHAEAKLSAVDVVAIRFSYIPRTITQRTLARRFGVSQKAIANVLKGTSYKEVRNA